jgi:acyl transferase domain-containing protein/enoyl-CoA hydratase/carnithine racemase/acyl carrier protein/ribosomal protein S18 acetylase RimI-like enzyme
MEEIIQLLFNREPFGEQPKYIVELGQGDGTLLGKIYRVIKNETLRGSVLDRYPLKLIRVDVNEQVSAETSAVLEDIDHLVLKGDSSKPGQVTAALKKMGSHDREDVLYIGKTISPVPVYEGLVEYFKGWFPALGKHGLVMQVDRYLTAKSAGRGLPGELPVEMDRFLMAAAEAGLFPRLDFPGKSSKTLSCSEMAVIHFEPREYRVRYAREKDLPALVQLEKECWPPGLRSSLPDLKKRLNRYPEGQLALELGMDNNVVGVIYSQRVSNPKAVETATVDTVEKLHREGGPVLQLLAVNILPGRQDRNLGDQLLEFMLQRCASMKGLQKVIGVTRCKDYHKHADISLQDYINLRNRQGRLVDAILRFHQLHGAQIKGLVPNYRPRDKKNNGYGVLVEYDVTRRRRHEIDVKGKSSSDNETIKDFIVKTIIAIAGMKADDFSLERPLMEMGLDSAHLLDLNERIRCQYRIRLEAAFFFKYNTAARIIDYLQEQSDRSVSGKQNDTGPEHRDSLTPSVQKPEIAIVGVSCRLPGGITDKERLWELLSDGKDVIAKLPPQRWSWPAEIDPEGKHKGIAQGGFLEEIADFDAPFFRISPKEAVLMDPQQRILLELSWACLEDAGYPAQALSGSKTGVFIGASGSDYNTLLNKHLEEIEAHFGLGTSMAVLSNRISYFFDFLGPSLQIDTACSSSLTAVHEAVKSLHAGECRQALVGGINILCHPSTSIAYYKAGMLSKDGRCKTFDKEADGYGRGEGGVMILLKPLAQALHDGDSVYAVIKGSAINHGGQASGLTVPNPAQQASLLVEAYKTAGVEPGTVGYIETHGTGTALGDPIEISGLKEAFSQLAGTNTGTRESSCGLGSIKTNLGHLEAAAGITGLLKVVLSLQHQRLPASLNFNELNPHITLENTPFYIVAKNQPWELPGGQVLRRAGVSSFGSGGTNAHVVLEEAPTVTGLSAQREPSYLICLSAKTAEALRKRQQDLRRWLEKKGPQVNLAEVSATLLLGREHFKHRAAYLAGKVQELGEKLGEALEKVHAGGYSSEKIPGAVEPAQPLFKETGQAILRELCPGKKMTRQEYDSKLAVLAELYVKGHDDLDWKSMYDVSKRYRISLPTYPFAGKRYWLPGSDTRSQGAAAPVVREESPPAIARLSLKSITEVGGSFASTPGKPRVISLPPLPIEQTPPGEPVISAPGVPLAQLLTGPAPAPVNPLRSSPWPDSLQEELAASLAGVLAMERSELDVDEKFVNLGMDSIISVEWTNTIKERYGIAVKAVKVYDYPTLRDFAGFLGKELEKQHRPPANNPVTAAPAPSPAPEPFPGRREDSRTASPAKTVLSPVIDLHEIEPGILQLTMQDRVHKNMFSRELLQGLVRAFETLRADGYYKAVILTGYDGFFSSGGTKEILFAIQEGKMKFTDINVFNLPLNCKIPVIAAMQGHGLGAGWALGMFCDFIVMSRDSIYTSNYMKLGFTPGAGATLIFPEKFGIALAQEILFTGKNYRGKDLEARGVPFPILPQKEVLPYAIELAKTLAQSPRESLIALKDNMAAAIRDKVSGAFAKEVAMHDRTFVKQSEVKERIQALFGEASAADNEKKPSVHPVDSQPGAPDPVSRPVQGAVIDSLAIIGMSGQFPRSKSLAAFWDNLARGRDCIAEIPAGRWSIDRYYSPDPEAPGKTYSKWMGVLEEVEWFDPLFFNISPAEAELMDPQQRLFLEHCWRCIEDAGLSPSSLSGSRCGVFVGCGGGDYLQSMSHQELNAHVFTGGAPAILSSRISYVLNLKGPCLAIDTACSSSLVALAEACNSLVLQSSDLALAGGVNVLAGPSMHIMTSKAGMLSRDGRCFTFDNRANGFVPGEGVGVILLKRFPEAVRDGDHIYGIIRGWGVNQDGKTNGITAPSVNSQILLEKEVYQRFNINPETISLVEAHGTGTKLGDPIELEALAEAFQSYTHKKNYCALGSVKSNIGHLLAAAGAAGVIKILLAMQHRMLPPTIHFKTLNEHISLDDSPFYVNTRLQPWETEPGTPRRAAVSSFGFSGTNAHVVVEEYLPGGEAVQEPGRMDATTPLLFVFSAKSKDQLKRCAQQMKAWVESQTDLNLADLAYTLQVGRDAMDYRMAFLAASQEAVLEALAGFIDSNPWPGVLTAHVKRNDEGEGIFAADEDAEALMQNWIRKRSLKKLAGLWVKGWYVDWTRFYDDSSTQKPRRISLPTYPFAREYYWLPKTGTGGGATTDTPGAVLLHPLLQQNTSNLSEQRFSSTFTGQEFFLADHVVQGQKVLPGVAYLEMAREAVARAAGALNKGQPGIRLKNVIWARSIAVGNQAVQVHIALFPENNGEIGYEIYSQPEAIDGEPVVHSQGSAVPSPLGNLPPLDLLALQAQCSEGCLDSSQCYEAFKAMGIDYGPAHQGIEKLMMGPGQALAKLSLPGVVSATRDQYVLHPALMDSALQASLGLLIPPGERAWSGDMTPLKLVLPFALEELEIFGHCTSSQWALVRFGKDSKDSAPGDKVQKLDIDLCDQGGVICVRMKGLSLRTTEDKPAVGLLMLQPYWKEQALAREAGTAVPGYDQHLVILCELEHLSRESIETHMNGVRCLKLPALRETLAERFQTHAVRIFEEIKQILAGKPKNKVLVQVVVANQAEQQLFSGLSGLLQTAHLENPHLIGQLIEAEPGEDWQTIVKKLEENRQCPGDNQIRYQGNKRWVIGWRPVEVSPEAVGIPWKDRGVYLITGGAGGLGLLLAKEIARQVKDPALILVGRTLRSQLTYRQQTTLKEWEAGGARIEYRRIDITREQEVARLLQGIREDFGGLNGILHGAGVIRDNFILKKVSEQFREVLAPKVQGLVNLDQASKDLDLDFLVLFSSLAGSLGNPGQADYSTANAFMDAYARYRNHLVALKQRQGQTLSINWPLWQEGGIQVDEEIARMMMQRTGMVAMQTSTGVQALYKGLASRQDQLMIIEGNLAQIKQKLLSTSTPAPPSENMPPGRSPTRIASDSLQEWVLAVLRQEAAGLLKVKVGDTDADTDLKEYGFDPITLSEFSREFNRQYKIELTPTIFSEHPTLRDLAKYLVEKYQAVFIEHFRQAHPPNVSLAGSPPLSTLEKIPAGAQDLRREKAVNYFKKLLSSTIKLPAHQIEADAPMEKYGIDSILIMALTNQLEKTFGSLPKTLFFEYRNLRELTDYFLESYPGKISKLPGFEENTADRGQGEEEREEERGKGTEARRRTPGSLRRRRFVSPGSEAGGESRAGGLDIAIIGLAGRYPQAKNIREFWKNLQNGKDCITEIPKERWDHSLFFDEDKNKPGKTYSKWGGFLEGVDRFDPLFFNISPREAVIMDPQERLFLECVYETLEDAGYTRDSLGENYKLPRGAGSQLAMDFSRSPDSLGLGSSLSPRAKSQEPGVSIGVFAGVMYEEYQLYGSQETSEGRSAALSGNPASIANRVSYFFDFHGPSMTVDTMCSSSLTTIHLACQSIRRGECQLAIAGGINISLHPNKYLFLAQGKFASSMGRCESFGQGGDGYVPGEGVGAVLLKPLSGAIADRDHIYGIIKATAINHGGKTNGYTVPNPRAQASVIGQALREAGFDPRTVGYIEAHGTGTSLGDPIEIAGLTKAFQEYTRDTQFCAIGSAKSNIGHCESAAGIAGVTKVLLQLHHGQLVPSLHSRVLNPNIQFSNTPFVVQQELAEWKPPTVTINGETRQYPRRAGISSFGAGGSNAHLLIEEYIPQKPEPPQRSITTQKPVIIVLSAKNAEQLRERVRQLLAAIADPVSGYNVSDLADMAYTLQVGREAMEERLAVMVGSIEALREKLGDFLAGAEGIADLYRGQVKRHKEALAEFAADEDMAKTIDIWISKQKYEKLLGLWVKGLVVDWYKLYSEGQRPQPRRISLPTYPFARERYWVSADGTPSQGAGAVISAPAADRVEDSPLQQSTCILKKQWEPCPAPSLRSLNRPIAILATPKTRKLATRVARHFPGSEILDNYHLESLLQQSRYPWEKYDGCIDLVGCGPDKSRSLGWLTWIQQSIEQGHGDGLTLLCVTRGLESYQNSAVNLSGAPRVGLYRMLQSEYSHLRSRHMDADPSGKTRVLAREIAGEFLMESHDPEVCYRKGKRYRAYLREIPAENDNLTARRAIKRFDQTFSKVWPPAGPPEAEKVLLITGGTRGLGSLCARHFVTRYGVKRLVLTGREVMPPRERWNSYQQQSTSIAQKIRAIQALEAQGAEVRVLSVSLTDERALAQGVQEIKQTMGTIGGVIHCAGTADRENPAFIKKSLEGMQRVLEPKVAGLDILFRCVKNEPLQFFVLFSSVAAIIPGLASGQGDYAMANAYMDYAAEANFILDSPQKPLTDPYCQWVSIQWPNWIETGMGEIKTRAYEQTGLLGLTDAEGLRFLDYILAAKMGPVVLPAVVNPTLWEPHRLMQRRIRQTAPGKSSPPRPGVERAEQAGTPASLVKAGQTWLISLFSLELKIDPAKLEIDTLFQDYGVDSVLLTQLVQKINRLLGEEIDPSVLYEYSTIQRLAAWLAGTHGLSLAKALEISTPDQPDPVCEETNLCHSHKPVQGPGKKAEAEALDLAVIGLSCRFPGARRLEEYWQLLSEGRSVLGPVPPERWGYDSGFHAGLIDNITHFDAKFFLVPEDDARVMDPQALLVLEESLNLFYQAGYSLREIKGKPVGVYLGGRSRHRPDEFALRQARNPIVAMGQNYLAANISHFFDLRGPALVLDTACSSALVAMNMAIQALHGGEIESALVGGVSLLNTDEVHRVFQQRGILSPEPHFHMFDQRARGVVLGEGVGMVLLKTVEQAVADGDQIYAVVKAVAVNNDGRSAGPATPNPEAQKEVLQRALSKSGKQPEEIGYIESNGSGSEVTDLLELKAIQSIYRSSSKVPCGLGSPKPNIGHLLCAEGIAGFIKVVLMLHHRQWVPFLSGEQPMTHYDMASSPFYFCRTSDPWTTSPQVAAINCFGDGGTNAHVILEAWADPGSGLTKRHPLPPPGLNRRQVQPDSFKLSWNTSEIHDQQTKETIFAEMIWETFK